MGAVRMSRRHAIGSSLVRGVVRRRWCTLVMLALLGSLYVLSGRFSLAATWDVPWSTARGVPETTYTLWLAGGRLGLMSEPTGVIGVEYDTWPGWHAGPVLFHDAERWYWDSRVLCQKLGEEHFGDAWGATWGMFVPFWPLLILLLVWTGVAWWVHLAQRTPGACTPCGYALAGLPAETPCPECGEVQRA